MTGLVIIGASYAGIHGALAARESGYSEKITVVADEEYLPYERPPLSKDFLLGIATEDSLLFRDERFFASNRIDLLLGTRATEIDKQSRKLSLQGKTQIGFDKLLIATGSRARRLIMPGADMEGVHYLRTMKDAISLKAALSRASQVVILGGGFIGLEVAASAYKLGKQVTVLEKGRRLLERAASPTLSKFLLQLHRQSGVDVRLGETIVSIEGRGRQIASVRCTNSGRIGADLLLVGVGGIANDEIARQAGLQCTSGISVNDQGCTSNQNIFAAGDCATHFNLLAQEWLRLESVQNAEDQAKAAGMTIAGMSAAYRAVPKFWSEQYDAKLQMVGLSRSFDTQVLRGSMEAANFSVFYYRNGQLIAVDSVNRPADQMVARRLIAAGVSPSSDQIRDLSFDLKALLKRDS